jgi:hypothetical protein
VTADIKAPIFVRSRYDYCDFFLDYDDVTNTWGLLKQQKNVSTSKANVTYIHASWHITSERETLVLQAYQSSQALVCGPEVGPYQTLHRRKS